MDKNMNLSIGIKGQLKLNAQAVPLQEGYLKLGGIVDTALANGLKFGVVVSADPDTADEFTAGCTEGNVVRGISVFDDSIAQNAPGHPDRYLAGMPCAALNHGFVFLAAWKKTSTGAADPSIGCKVIYKDTTGEIEFIPASGSAAEGWTVLTSASVRDIDQENGALIYLD